LRILFLTQTYPRFAADVAGPFIREIARGLTRLGDRVTVLAPHARGVAQAWNDDGVEVRTFRYAPERWEVLGYGRSLEADEGVRAGAGLVAPLYALAARAATRRELRRGRATNAAYDWIHAHWIVPNAVLLGRLSTPLAIGLHGSDVFLAERGGLRPFVRRALGRARALTGCSGELVDRVMAVGGGALAPERARVIPYGVDVERFAPPTAGDAGRAGRGAWRDRFGIPDEACLLGTVGRMATKKGFHVLVAALPELLARHPTAHVVLAGGGDRLEEFRRALAPHAARVHFPGVVLQDVLPDLYRAMDAFVLPAVHDRRGNVDGLPNVILEAMATGLPVVASGISGIPLAVEDGRTGRLVAEGDAAELVEALDEVLGSAERRRAWGASGREKVVRELTWDAVAGSYQRVYRELVTRELVTRELVK
jgi:glycosyltransferase involved in cell wall biosynthesis